MSRLVWHKGLLVGNALGGKTFYVWLPKEPTPELLNFAKELVECQPMESNTPIDALERWTNWFRVNHPLPAAENWPVEGPYAEGRKTVESLLKKTKGPVNRTARKVAKTP